MSNWTHVAAIARIDAFRLHEEFDFVKIFGKELSCYDSNEIWNEADEHPERFLPLGSEGSLTMTVWTNPDLACLDAYTISIFGDLRDHDDPNDVIEWFKEKLSPFMVRNACITVHNEWNGTVNWVYEEDEKEREFYV